MREQKPSSHTHTGLIIDWAVHSALHQHNHKSPLHTLFLIKQQVLSLLPQEPENSSITSSEEHFWKHLEEGMSWSGSRLNDLWCNSRLKLKGKAELNHRRGDLRRVRAPCTDCMKGGAAVTTVLLLSISTSHAKRSNNPKCERLAWIWLDWLVFLGKLFPLRRHSSSITAPAMLPRYHINNNFALDDPF